MDKRVMDSAETKPQVFEWGEIRWLHSGEVSDAQGLTVGEVVINPGQENPVHSHPNCEEVLYLISGDLVHTCGDEGPYRLKPGMVIRVPTGVRHNAKCITAEPARMIVAYSSAFRQVSHE